jgi:hypothetical protein
MLRITVNMLRVYTSLGGLKRGILPIYYILISFFGNTCDRIIAAKIIPKRTANDTAELI